METTEKPKRTYQKHKTEKKITVKHYVIKDVERNENGYYEFPIYVQVTYNRKNTKFRSKIPYTVNDDIPSLIPVFDNFRSFEEFYMTNVENNAEHDFDKSLENALIRETNFIIWLTNQQIKISQNGFEIADISEVYHSKQSDLTNFIELCLKREIQSTLFEIAFPEVSEYFHLGYAEFPIYDNTSALNNLEFYMLQYPQIISLKKKYSSQIWFLDIFLEQSQFSFGGKFKPIFSIQDPYDFVTMPLTPTIYDYLTNTFQRCFYSTFEDKQLTRDIISDIDKLFAKYSSEF